MTVEFLKTFVYSELIDELDMIQQRRTAECFVGLRGHHSKHLLQG